MDCDIGNLSAEQERFVESAKAACAGFGEQAVLLLVGSRASGFACPDSDVDMWILGDKEYLSEEDARVYEQRMEVLRHCGPAGAHWSFYDIDDMTDLIQTTWQDEKMWVISTAQHLSGCRETMDRIKQLVASYPEDVVEAKLRMLIGEHRVLRHSLQMSARNHPVTAFTAAGRIMETLSRICCVADRRPYPYLKWLDAVARTTRLGPTVFPYIDRAMASLDELLHPPSDTHYEQWTPVKELMGALQPLQEGLKANGWDREWVDKPWMNIGNYLNRLHA